MGSLPVMVRPYVRYVLYFPITYVWYAYVIPEGDVRSHGRTLLPVNFELPIPFRSRLRARHRTGRLDRLDGQADGKTTTINALCPTLLARGIIQLLYHIQIDVSSLMDLIC